MILSDLSIEEVERRGLHRVISDCGGEPVRIYAPGGARVVLVSESEYLHAEQAAEVTQDVFDLVVALSREISDNGHRTPLDRVIKELGFTREELAALDD